MTSQNHFARSLFMGRIGEAVVESVLMGFGYQVSRSGREFHRLPSLEDASSKEVYAPDLAVTDPKTQTTRYVEVKLRSSRPMTVVMEKARLESLRRFYPGSVLVFVSSYNGSVNCANVDEMAPNNVAVSQEGLCEFDLLRRGWRPIWAFFPRVQPGEKLANLWADITDDLHSFAQSQMRRTKSGEAFPEERDRLEEYISDNWAPVMQLYVPGPPNTADLDIDELWEIVRKVEGCHFALDLHGEENAGTDEFSYTIDRLLGRRGEKYISIDLRRLRTELINHPEYLKRFDELMQTPDRDELAHSYHQIDAAFQKQFFEEFLPSLPPGVGKVYLLPDQGTVNEAIEIDFRTALALSQRRNRLDQTS